MSSSNYFYHIHFTMSNSRRDFLKNAAILSGAAGLTNVLPLSIKKAAAINAKPGTTFYDAEHIVFLMQENRSFDHMFGRLKGVRGFNDPRTKTVPDGNKVWIQKDKKGNAHAPFHIDINKTKITWQGGLPHGWVDQSAARNHGKYDNWIPEKSSMTMGHYDRSDVPFYYALADAFTICDHNFCSSLTGTTPNRLFFWTGNIRPELSGDNIATVNNSQAESRDDVFVDWSTFPELLEDNDISWKVYQNELWTSDLKDDTDYWLGNYGDNALEYIRRNNVRLSAYFRKNGDKSVKPHLTPKQVTERYNRLTQRQKNLVDKCFSTNIDDEDYLTLTPFSFTNDEGKEQTVNIPKGDIFKQFRSDVDKGTLPTVSWLVAPQSFSDHTSTPLYGTWYVSQALDILTKNPEVWKKTIFILNYDENDGYFDHLPPFVVPKPGDADAGKISEGIGTDSDYENKDDTPIGLGYRVPMIIASPWSKGGFVNSQVFDHTSCLMFLENFLKKKTGKELLSPNISSWRRNICGDLSSIFRPYNGEKIPLPGFEKKDAVITNIQNAKNKPKQVVPAPLTEGEIDIINRFLSLAQENATLLPQQEKGTKPACALPYQLFASCEINSVKDKVILQLTSSKLSVGAPFNAYTQNSYKGEKGKTWAYAVRSGDTIEDIFEIDKFENGQYNICLNGPNGFYRKFEGSKKDAAIRVQALYEERGFLNKRPTGNIHLIIENKEPKTCAITLIDNAYKMQVQNHSIDSNEKKEIIIQLKKSSGWYDFTVKISGSNTFCQQFAGHVETGEVSTTDPFMGGELA